MKSRISLVFSVVTAVLLSSCAAMAQMQVKAVHIQAGRRE